MVTRNTLMIIGTICLLVSLLQICVPSTDNDPHCDPAIGLGNSNNAQCQQAWAARGSVSTACAVAGLAFMAGAIAAALGRPREPRMPQMPMARPPAAGPGPGPGPYGGQQAPGQPGTGPQY